MYVCVCLYVKSRTFVSRMFVSVACVCLRLLFLYVCIYRSTLRRLKNKLSPFKTEIPEVLRQKYGGTKLSRKLRKGLLKVQLYI